jgi:hypothetical protein
MVLRLKTRKSRSLPGLPRTDGKSLLQRLTCPAHHRAVLLAEIAQKDLAGRGSQAREGLLDSASREAASEALQAHFHSAAGWSSPVARQAHNLKVVGSNPTPATTKLSCLQRFSSSVQLRHKRLCTSFGGLSAGALLAGMAAKYSRYLAWIPTKPCGDVSA